MEYRKSAMAKRRAKPAGDASSGGEAVPGSGQVIDYFAENFSTSHKREWKQDSPTAKPRVADQQYQGRGSERLTV